MARRYGGKFSPEAQDVEDTPPPPRGGFDGARVDPVGARANALFLPLVPLVALSLTGGAVTLALGLAAAAALALAAVVLREGLRAEAAYDARRVARRPALPRKLAASLLTGIGAGLASWWNEPGLAAALIFGVAAAALHVAAFGIDPLRDKGDARIDSFQRDRVARVASEAEANLRAMSQAIARTGDRRLETRVARFQTTARDLIRTLEEDPRDLSAARCYLSVYLPGARDATAIFADIHARTRDAQARADYLALLDDLERNFAARTARMLLDDRSDLSVEIDVLRERLMREGVRPDPADTTRKRQT